MAFVLRLSPKLFMDSFWRLLCIDSIEPAKNYVLFVNWLCKHQSSLSSEVIKAYLLCSRSAIMAVLLSSVENVALFMSADRIVV